MKVGVDVCVFGILSIIALVFILHGIKRREKFSIGNIFGKAKEIAIGSFNVAKNVIKPPAYQSFYTGRSLDQDTGRWICSSGYDTGRDNSQACLQNGFTSQSWRWNGSEWGWSCPVGFVPNNDDQWERKCQSGYTNRVKTDLGYKCPFGTTDTGTDWTNSDWFSAWKQCSMTSPYTRRELIDGKYQCPAGYEDTGKSWGMQGEEKQCVLTAG